MPACHVDDETALVIEDKDALHEEWVYWESWVRFVWFLIFLIYS